MENFLAQGFDISKCRSVANELFLQEKALRSNFILSILNAECTTGEAEEWVISLLKEINHEMEIKIDNGSGYSSRNSVLTSAVKKCHKPLFDEVIKCKIDFTEANKDVSKVKDYQGFDTLFTEALIAAKDMACKPRNANFALEYLLSLPLVSNDDIKLKIEDLEDDTDAVMELSSNHAKLVKRHREAIRSLLGGSLVEAEICAKHGYYLSDFEMNKQYANDTDYVTNTVNDLFKGFSAQIDIESNSLEREYEKQSAEESVFKLANIKAIITADGADQKEYLKPLFDPEKVLQVLTEISKDINKGRHYSSKVRIAEKISRTFSFFEDIMGRESLIFDETKKSTRTLFALSKNNYAIYIVNHYLKKLGLETLAAHASGIEQAKYIMESFDVDPITMTAMVNKDAIKKQLMELIATS